MEEENRESSKKWVNRGKEGNMGKIYRERRKSECVRAVDSPALSWDTIGFVHNEVPGFRFGHGFRVSAGE